MTNGSHGSGTRAQRPEHSAMERLREIIEATREESATAQELVLDAVREAILTGVLEPEMRLRQEELADLFGTSRIPIREALRALEYEGLVRSEPHRGFTVTALDADDVEEVYELRILLETHALRLALPLLTDEDLEELEALYTTLRTATTPDEQLAARERFYIHIYSATGRPRLVGLIVRLRQEVARGLRWPTLQQAPAVHESFWEAVRTGDGDRAAAQLSAHYKRVAGLIRRYLRETNLQAKASSRSLSAIDRHP